MLPLGAIRFWLILGSLYTSLVPGRGDPIWFRHNVYRTYSCLKRMPRFNAIRGYYVLRFPFASIFPQVHSTSSKVQFRYWNWKFFISRKPVGKKIISRHATVITKCKILYVRLRRNRNGFCLFLPRKQMFAQNISFRL